MRFNKLSILCALMLSMNGGVLSAQTAWLAVGPNPENILQCMDTGNGVGSWGWNGMCGCIVQEDPLASNSSIADLRVSGDSLAAIWHSSQTMVGNESCGNSHGLTIFDKDESGLWRESAVFTERGGSSPGTIGDIVGLEDGVLTIRRGGYIGELEIYRRDEFGVWSEETNSPVLQENTSFGKGQLWEPALEANSDSMFSSSRAYQYDSVAGVWLEYDLNAPPGEQYRRFEIDGDTAVAFSAMSHYVMDDLVIFKKGNTNTWQISERYSLPFASPTSAAGIPMSLKIDGNIIVIENNNDEVYTFVRELAGWIQKETFSLDTSTGRNHPYRYNAWPSRLSRTVYLGDSRMMVENHIYAFDGERWAKTSVLSEDSVVADSRVLTALRVENNLPLATLATRPGMTDGNNVVLSMNYTYSSVDGSPTRQDKGLLFVTQFDSEGRVILSNEAGSCDYTSAYLYGGWGWNMTTGQSCPPLENEMTEPEASEGSCDYSNADIYGGWGWNATTGQSCPALEAEIVEQETSLGSCDYSNADIYGGWGWNATLGESCPPPAMQPATPSNNCVDNDNDGWGWNGTSSCRV